ncbi:hypothetical protein Hlac_3231 [Halorubrum lacusprofundi ATCC 49239]|uniref:Uncharacterized protein n=1 Tax=Halorubrum lacusprofundi (strain ATCC 49239 / DSM 5036 / JCM 8891 / ACAM 34) TaxID=416348 RepID=B9LVP9_HALLT|nr:hypothetical protein [Halorubrum lacusprofundi]ACM58762.1 hypothetical protein Hlac_3231 [Halorubrum lacusprofundi ATCC 49239]
MKDREDLLQETAKQNPSTEQLRRVYAPHLSRLTNTRSRVEDLQQAILYHTLSIEQSNRYPTLLEYAANVCDEVDKRLKIDATYLPVVWDAFASYGVIHQDYYAIHLPRQNDVFSDSPLLAHELGHAVVDHLSTEALRGFRKELEGFVSEFRERQRPLVRATWQEWFPELLCDACGALIFGPAYLSAVVSNLQSKQPYFLPQYSDEIGHPPDALRYRYVTAILENRLNSNVLDNLGEAVNSYEAHLSILERDKSSEYDSWIEQNLLNAIEEIAERQIDVDLTRLMEETFGKTSVSETRHLRVEANRLHLGLRTEGD